jgi:RNA polymerase primary sigma factor
MTDGLEGLDATGQQRVEAPIREDERLSGSSGLPDPAEVAVDPLQKYLNEISAIPLLSVEEENSLAKRARQGVEARGKLEKGDLKGEAVERLHRLDERGKMASRLLFQANLRFVVHVAKRYRWSKMSMMDLIQEGNIGLLNAVEKFDHSKGARFSTYAAFWIKQAIGRAIARQSRPVRLPEDKIQAVNDINSIRRWLETKEGREADSAEIALETGMLSAEDVASIRTSLASDKPLNPTHKKRWCEAAGKISQLMNLSQEAISLAKPAAGEEDRTLEEQLKDGSNQDPLIAIQRQQIKDKICEVLDCLGEMERQVLMMRFGLQGDGEMTVDEVAEELDITSERVKQLEKKAIRCLRRPDISDRLKDIFK